jgi:hypothetical protein
VSKRNAALPFESYAKHFYSVITNPPFGTLENPVTIDGFTITALEHLMCIYALHTMHDNGRAALIIGGHAHWDDKGRLQAGKNRIFFNYLYSHYNVEDVIMINGKKLYARQGTGFNTRIILINGRKKTVEGVAPLFNASKDIIIHSFDTLYDRMKSYLLASNPFSHINMPDNNNMKSVSNVTKLRAIQLLRAMKERNNSIETLESIEGIYQPVSNAPALQTQVPDSMDFETLTA